MYKISLLAWLLLATTTIVKAQNKLCGVVNSKTQPIGYAVLKCLNNNKAVVANAAGEFCFDNLPDGNFEIEISCLGYNKKIVSVAVPLNKSIALEIEQGTFQSAEIIVSATRASYRQAATFQIIDKKEIEKLNIGQDLPYIFQYTPSVVTTSDAGAGVGYTSMRIRGTDGTRINTTVNGVPANDAESQSTYFVDFPDLASSAQSIQIQRGVGTSSNGSGAFGASINIQTITLRDSAYAKSNNSFGSFNTLKNTIMFGTGLINNHFTLNGRLSRIVSDGFIDRASSNLRSMYLDASYFGKKFSVHYVNFSGLEKTFQAWNGVPQSKINASTNDSNLINHYYNNLGYLYNNAQDSSNLFGSNNSTYNYFTYKNQTDNYAQYNHQLHFTYNVNNNLFVNATAHFTKGLGYYEEYKLNENFYEYGIAPVIVKNDTIANSTLIRRKWLDNNFYGLTYSIHYKNGRLQSVVGGSSNKYLGNHFTNIIWAEYAANTDPLANYQFNKAIKNDHSAYLKNNYSLTDNIDIYTDLQYRYVDYNFELQNQLLQSTKQLVVYHFFNPKVGFRAKINDANSMYTSFSVANREPTRDDFIAATTFKKPTFEQLQDLEIGYKLNKQKLVFEAVVFLMNYKNQLVLTGELNDVGSALRSNVAKSYRSGIELSAEYKLTKNLKIFGNTTISQNKIANFQEYIYNYYSANIDSITLQINEYKNTDISFSPKLIAVGGWQWQLNKNLALFYAQKYVANQYLDNTQNNNRMLNAFATGDVKLMFSAHTKWCRQLNAMFTINNIYNKKYASNGYTYSSKYDGNLITENFLYPQAGRNFMATFIIGF